MAKRANLKLKKVLDRHQGKDYSKIKQVKLQKAAEKRKKSKVVPGEEDVEDDDEEDDEDEVLVTGENDDEDEIDGAEVDAFLKSLGGEDGGEDGEWATDEDEEDDDDEEEFGYDLSRLEDSDSDMSDSELDEPQPKKKATPLKATKTKAPAPAKITKSSAAVALPIKNALNPEDEEEEEDEDIPLSDIESLGSNSDEADIIPHQRLTINNTAALTRALSLIALPLSTLPFSEHQSITLPEPTSIPDIEDDLSRELAFYAQSLAAAKSARQQLRAEKYPFTRPTDFFAEMVKSDEHMGKIKAKLLDDATAKQASADARRQRDLKKFGKQVQQEKLKERAADKREMLDKVNLLKRKRQGEGLTAEKEGDIFDVALEEEVTAVRKERDARRGGAGGRGGARGGSSRGGGSRGGRDASSNGRDGSSGQANPKRARKDEKYGFGGKKRFGKSGDAESSADMSGFSTKRMKSGGRGGSAGGRGGRGGGRGGSGGGGGVKKLSAPRMGKSKRDSRK